MRRIDRERDLPALQIVLEHLFQLAHQRPDLDHLHLLPAGFDARQLQQLGNQVGFGLHVFLDALQAVDHILIELFAVLEEQNRSHAADVAQRGVEIVADGAEEIFLLGDLAGEPLVGGFKLRGALIDFSLQIGIGMFELIVGFAQVILLPLNGVHHLVECAGEVADHVQAMAVDLHAQVAARDPVRDVHELADGAEDPVDQQIGQRKAQQHDDAADARREGIQSRHLPLFLGRRHRNRHISDQARSGRPPVAWPIFTGADDRRADLQKITRAG